MAFEELNGPSKQFSVSLTNSTVIEVKDGSSPLSERKVVTIMPLDGKIWVYFGDGTNVPNSTTVKTDGFPQFKNTKESYEASDSQELYIVSDSGTVDVRIAERA